MNIEPNKRFMVEPSLECNILCAFCYHKHKYNEWHKTRKTLDQVKTELDKGKIRGNEWVDISGGEPTIYPDMAKVIEYAHSIGLKVCIITNGIVSEKRTQELIDAGIDEFLVSRHGLEDVHNLVTNTKTAYKLQNKFLKMIKGKIPIRFNCVIIKLNQFDLQKVAMEISIWEPRVINFINFNPHGEWKNIDFSKNEIMADLRQVRVNINKAIEYLEANDIGINVRYYPMCRIEPKYRKYICNDLHVMFDPYEWDYGEYPKTIERYYKHGRAISNVEEKGQPCCNCDLQWVCGGINKHYHRVSKEIYGELCEPQTVPEVRGLSDIEKAFYYRKDYFNGIKD